MALAVHGWTYGRSVLSPDGSRALRCALRAAALAPVALVTLAVLAAAGARADSSAGPLITTVVGNHEGTGYAGDGGLATAAAINTPQGVAIGPGGVLYMADAGNQLIRRVDANGIITTIAGVLWSTCPASTDPCGDGGPATQAQFMDPDGVTVAPNGDLYVADNHDYRVRLIPAHDEPTLYGLSRTYGPTMKAGDIYTVAGSGIRGDAGDGGPATQAQIEQSETDAVAADGTLYIADLDADAVREVSPDGTITTLASGLGGALGIAVNGAGDVYVATLSGERVDEIASDGTVSVLAGTGAICPQMTDPCGDGGPASAAQLNYPHGLALAPDGTVYFSDRGDERIRAILPDGTIETVAGDGIVGYTGDGGPATAAEQRYPEAVGVGADGNLYIADASANVVREVATGVAVQLTAPAQGATVTYGTPQTVSYTMTSNSPDLTAACTLDTAPVPCTTQAAELGALTAGPHTFTVTATADGGADEASGTVNFTVVPTVSITAAPADSTATTQTVGYAVAADAAHSVSCALDAAPPVPCSASSQELDGLTVGQHTFTVTVTDGGEQASASTTFQTLAPPTVTIAPAPAPSATGSGTVSYQESGAVSTTVCTLDSLPVACSSSSAAFSGLAVGAHAFTVSVLAADGTSDSAQVSVTVLPAPAVTITQAPAASSTATSATVLFAASGTVQTVACALDFVPVACSDSTAALSGLSVGAHTFTVTVSGGGLTVSARVAFTVSPPPVSPSPPASPSPPRNSSPAPRLVARASAVREGARGRLVRYRLEGGRNSAASYAWYRGGRLISRQASFQVALGRGQRATFTLVVSDAAGRRAQTTVTVGG